MSPAVAQTGSVSVGWVDAPPFIFRGHDGGNRAFATTVSQRIAEIADLSVDENAHPSLAAAVSALAAGADLVLAAVPLDAAMPVGTAFSLPLATSRTRLFVQADRSLGDGIAQPVGLRLGYLPAFPGAPPPPLLAQNTTVMKTSPQTLLTMLLTGEIDGAVMPENWVLALAHGARLDHRIAAVGPVLQAHDLVMATGPGQLQLLGLLDDAIAAMAETGELADLQRSYFFVDASLPKPEAVLRVGVLHFPPYNVIEQDGSFTGFSVETTRDLAALAGLEVEFVELTREEWARGPSPDTYDIITQAGVTDERRVRMDFTQPIERAPVSIFLRDGEAAGITDLDDLVGLRVGVERVNLARRLAEQHGGLDLTVLDGPAALLDGLVTGRVDAVLYPMNALDTTARERRLARKIEAVEPPFFITERAIALRFGLGQVRERLNGVIPGYLASDRYFALRAEWFQPETFWTDGRLTLAVQIAALTLALILGLILWVLYRGRLADERRRVAGELIDNIPLGLLLISPDGTIGYSNANLRKRTQDGERILRNGRKFRDAVEELLDHDIVSSESLTRPEMLMRMTETGMADGFEDEYQLTIGRTYVRKTKRLGQGETLLMYRDVTDERERMAQIQRLNASLEEKIRQAKVANDDLRAFAYGTSHDLKSPTNTALMLLDALVEEMGPTADQTQRTLMGQLKQTVERMRELIDDVLVYTNVVDAPGQHEHVDLNTVANAVLGDMRADSGEAGAEVTLGDLPSLHANRSQMRQLMSNLLSNAVKFRTPGRTPAISVQPVEVAAGFVGFSVSDNGIGIPPEHQDRIFQMFARLHPASGYSGSGLGLAICHRIALNLGGHITVSSEVDKGATFTVVLRGEAP